jgi:hypothetical protein
MGISTVAELESQIRNIFNISRRHKKTRTDRAAFYQACSAMDAIGDTEIALQEFINTEISFDLGIRYLLAYGLLQAIFLQQDAIQHLALSLGIPFSLPDELKEIRDLRNDAVGHPTNRNRGKSFHHISRVTLSTHGFQLLSNYSDNSASDIRDVKYKDILSIQSHFCEKLLLQILDTLRNDENAHMERFMSDKLSTIFHSSLSYLFEKVGEGIRDGEHRQFGLNIFEMIMKMISSFRSKLIERGEEESIECVMEELSYPTAKVRLYLEGAGQVDKRAAEIFIEYIEKKADDLKQIAIEIDEGYEEIV